MRATAILLMSQFVLVTISGCLVNDDSDGDGWSDSQEMQCGTDKRDVSDTPKDQDNDGKCDATDPDFAGLLEHFRSIREFDNFDFDKEWYAMNITTWQMDNGGWRKDNAEGYTKAYNGTGFSGSHFANLATFANKATTAEIRYLAQR